ncbi:hypothetical protein [Rufibacter sp. LB8]|uniref:hypothetical protein n=1 Tax=Rufibacter sp. LB8 TaxID=2777781 RepID=UPI00178C7E88|nr:hypothetical protein [Rufibacter sp. LB8]
MQKFPLLLASLLSVGILTFTACDTTSQEAKQEVNQTENKAELELAELRDWMKDKTEKVDSAADRKWPQIKEEFKEKSSQLDSRVDSLSVKSKEEYKELRRKFNNWEARNAQREALPLHPETMDRFKTELLGSADALNQPWAATHVRNVYTTFLQNVRARHGSWTASDWEYASALYRQLNAKKDDTEANISLLTQDKLKIKALQAEFLALEKAKATKQLYKEIR